VSRNGGSYVSLSLPSSLATSVNRPLAVGSTFRFRVRAIDRKGNVGGWKYGPTFKVLRYQESSAAYTGAWSFLTSIVYSGGHERRTSVVGAEARFSFVGRNVGWVTTRGPTRGTAQVYVDGSLAATVNLARSTLAYRSMI